MSDIQSEKLGLNLVYAIKLEAEKILFIFLKGWGTRESSTCTGSTTE